MRANSIPKFNLVFHLIINKLWVFMQQHLQDKEKRQRQPIKSFTTMLLIMEIIIIVLFIIFARMNTANIITGDALWSQRYSAFQDVNVMIVVGFGFLMTFIKRHSWSALAYTFFINAIIVQTYILLKFFWQRVWKGFSHEGVFILIDQVLITESSYAVASALIAFGALIGRIGPRELLIIGWIQMIGYQLNEVIVLHSIKALDAGGSMTIHAFGVYFGLTVSLILSHKIAPVSKPESNYVSNIVAMIGTLFLLLFWPSFNFGEFAQNPYQQTQIVTNTLLSLTGSCVATFIFSGLLGHKFQIEDILNATLAGGVAIGSSCGVLQLFYLFILKLYSQFVSIENGSSNMLIVFNYQIAIYQNRIHQTLQQLYNLQFNYFQSLPVQFFYSQMINPENTHTSYQSQLLLAKLHCLNCQFQLAEDIADRLFQKYCTQQAIKIYQMIIESNINFDYQIDGLGNNEQQNGYYEWNIPQWYFTNKQHKIIKGSPYDALSLCYAVKINITEQGQNWYSMMLSKYPDNYQILMGYGNVLYNKKHFEQALKIYEQVILIKPSLVRAYTSIAFVYEYQRIQKTKSIKWADRALLIYQKNEFALFIKARNQKDVQIKLQKLKQVNALYPKNTRIINQIGIVYGGSKKDYSKAIEWYTKCITLNPNYCSAHNNIGVNYELKKEYQDAKIWYYKAVELDKQYKAAHKNLTDIYDTLQMSEEDILQQSRLYKIEQDWFCYEIGLSYYDKKQVDKSISWYLKTIKINSGNHKFYNSLAISYDQKKQFDEAISYYKKCILIEPKYFSAYYNIAITYKNTDKIQQAIQWYCKCIEINPKHSYSYNNLGNIYKNKGLYQQAIKYYCKAIEFLSTYTLALTNLGICYENIKKYREAINCYQKAEQLLPTDNNSLSKSNKQFIQNQIKKFKKQTMQWRMKGVMSANINDIKNSMIQEFQLKLIELFSKKQQSLQKINYLESMEKVSQMTNDVKIKQNNIINEIRIQNIAE